MKISKYINRCFDLFQQSVSIKDANRRAILILTDSNGIIDEKTINIVDYNEPYQSIFKNIDLTKEPQISDTTLFILTVSAFAQPNNTIPSNVAKRLKIKKVISISDIFKQAAFDTINEKTLEHPYEIDTNLLRHRFFNLSKAPTIWKNQQRPYIILKFATSADGFIGQKDQQVWLSNRITKIISHKWRAEVDGILVGTNTAEIDNPSLTNRLSTGSSPTRLVIDRKLRLRPDLHLFDQQHPTWIFTSKEGSKSKHNITYFTVEKDQPYITAILKQLYNRGKTSLLVEGGASLLQRFINAGLWDEVRIFRTPVVLEKGIRAPSFSGKQTKRIRLKNNWLEQWIKETTSKG